MRYVADMTETADFGFESIAKEDKAGRVRQVFDRVAGDYDLMNDLMSGGLHRLWKDAFVTWLRPRNRMTIVDLAGGTGDIARRILRRGGNGVQVTVCDINREMLQVGRARFDRRRQPGDLRWLCADGEALPLESQSVDAVTVAFGIRNMTDKAAALGEAWRVLKPGGRFICLEFSRLALPGLSGLYDRYSFSVVPRLGRLVARDEEAYRYLVESIRTFPDQDRFKAMIEAAGLAKVQYRNLSGGIAAMHSAWRI